MAAKEAHAGRCSWCFAHTRHDLVEQNYLRRNAYQCRTCLGRTLVCRIPTCDDMARGHAGYDDERCAVHSGLIPNWAKRPQSKYARCSWCFDFTQHRIVEQNSTPLRRDVYECEACSRRTLPCRTCELAMARGHAGIDDERCAKCDGTIDDWNVERKMARKKTARRGWCSWCFERCDHVLEEKNTTRRDVYHCDNCLARSLSCMKCKEGMTRGGPGWDDNLCERCFGAVSDWGAAKRKRDEILEQEWGAEQMRAQLGRSSEAKSAALAAGMIRPFLYLVSMDPVMRNQVASALGWSLYAQDYFGDPHAEAWDIIHASSKGIQARTNESWETLNPIASNCNWYETLYRTAKEVFKTVEREKKSFSASIHACRSSSDRTLPRFEDWYVGRLAKLQAVHMSQAHMAEIEELLDAEEVRQLAAAMKAAGIGGGLATLRYAVTVVHNAIRAGGFNTYILTVKIAAAMNRNIGTKIVMSQATKTVARFATALNVAGWIWLAADVLDMVFGSSHGRAFPAVNQILNQRLLLAAEGIEIEEHY